MALRLSHRFAQALASGAARQALRTVLNQTVPVNAVLSLTTSLSQQFNLQKRLFSQISSVNGPALGAIAAENRQRLRDCPSRIDTPKAASTAPHRFRNGTT